ncbi:Glutathione peroxidase [Aphelenchoides fujianensis]|nr:Glutathione peroxidase [Aphelenchoides fujianensis]
MDRRTRPSRRARIKGVTIAVGGGTPSTQCAPSGLALCGLAVCALAAEKPGPKLIDETTRWSTCHKANISIHDFSVETLDGESTDLSKYKGKVVLVINVATFCAYTQQYTDFNPLIEKNRGNGDDFAIVAFPCNQFYLQEPAENHEIMNGITHVRPGNGWKPHRNLHIYGKVEVNGANHHPLYEFLKCKYSRVNT